MKAATPTKAASLIVGGVVRGCGERRVANINDFDADEIVLFRETALRDGPCPECGVHTGDCKGAEDKVPTSNGAHAHACRHRDWERE